MSICRTAVLTAGTCESLSQGLDGEAVDGEVLEKGTKQIVALLEVRDIVNSSSMTVNNSTRYLLVTYYLKKVNRWTIKFQLV